jgi:hypothetical protein
MRSKLLVALTLATALTALAPPGEAAAQRTGRVHRQSRAHAGDRVQLSVDLGPRSRGYRRYDDYDGYDRYERHDRYDRYDRYYDRFEYDRAVLEARYRDGRVDLGIAYREPRYRYRYRRAGVLDVVAAVARAAARDDRYRDHRGRRVRRYRYYSDL